MWKLHLLLDTTLFFIFFICREPFMCSACTVPSMIIVLYPFLYRKGRSVRACKSHESLFTCPTQAAIASKLTNWTTVACALMGGAACHAAPVPPQSLFSALEEGISTKQSCSSTPASVDKTVGTWTTKQPCHLRSGFMETHTSSVTNFPCSYEDF